MPYLRLLGRAPSRRLQIRGGRVPSVLKALSDAHSRFKPSHESDSEVPEESKLAIWIDKTDWIISDISVQIDVAAGKADGVALREAPEGGVVVAGAVVDQAGLVGLAARVAVEGDGKETDDGAAPGVIPGHGGRGPVGVGQGHHTPQPVLVVVLGRRAGRPDQGIIRLRPVGDKGGRPRPGGL